MAGLDSTRVATTRDGDGRGEGTWTDSAATGDAAGCIGAGSLGALRAHVGTARTERRWHNEGMGDVLLGEGHRKAMRGRRDCYRL